MALQEIAKVSISLNTSGVSRAGFGTPIFITAHNYFSDRVRAFSSSTDVGAAMTTGSNGYAAAVSAFSNEPSVDTLKIGRLIASSIIAPQGTGSGGAVETGITYTIDVEDVNEDTVSASYTTLGGDSLSDIVTALVADINGGSLDLTVTNNGDTFTLSRPSAFPTSDFVISNLSDNITVTAADDGNTEDVTTALAEIQLVDDDFYAVAWEDHTDKDEILELADTIESLDKIYFVGSAHEDSIDNAFTLGDEPSSDDDILGWLADGNYMRTIGWWHQDADTDFNELAFAGYNLPFEAGSVVWANLQVPVSNAKNSDGNKLTTQQEQNLSDRYANWASVKGGIIYTREGKVAGNEWIDNIRGRDNLKADLEADLFDVLTNQQGQKIPYTDKGINIIAGIVKKRLNDYKDGREFLTDPIVVNVPKAKDILREDKVTRVLRDLSFKAKLAGGIQLVEIFGTLEV